MKKNLPRSATFLDQLFTAPRNALFIAGHALSPAKDCSNKNG
jgi:hypothetical protein